MDKDDKPVPRILKFVSILWVLLILAVYFSFMMAGPMGGLISGRNFTTFWFDWGLVFGAFVFTIIASVLGVGIIITCPIRSNPSA